MARGISIKDVENKVQNINDNNVLPISTGADVPEVVEVGTLKEHIQEGLDFYEKPSAGIPKSDLAADVRTSLGKADTALQSFTETDPTVPSWAKASTKPSYTAAEVGALPDTTAIPTESTVSGWGFTKNAGTVTSVTVNGSTYNPTNGDVDLGTIGGGGGTSVQADWAQTDNTADDYIKNKPSSNSFYYAAWTASSSAGYSVKLTDTLTLPEGIYILVGRYPILSKSMLTVFNLTNIETSATKTLSSGLSCFQGQNYTPIVDILFVGQGGGEIYLQTGANTSTTYSYLERGYISAFKII